MTNILTRKNSHLIHALPTNGIYSLVVFLSKEIRLKVGKLGHQKFLAGYYAYTGSALGIGASNLKQRISRHLKKKKRNFWHIDFLLANEEATLTTVVAAQTHQELECKLNSFLKTEEKAKIPAKGFGASDCKKNCESHLLFFPYITEESVLVQKIVRGYEVLGLTPMSQSAR